MSAGRGLYLRVSDTIICSEEWLEAQRGVEVRAKNLVVLPRDQMQYADDIMRAMQPVLGDTPTIFAGTEEAET